MDTDEAMATTQTTTDRTRSISSGVEYHRVLAGPKRRIGRGVLAILLLFTGMIVATQLLFLGATWLDALVRPAGESASLLTSPLLLGSSLVAVALLTPLSMVIQRWLYGVEGASLHSVVRRFRFDLFGRALIVIVPLFAIALSISAFLDPESSASWRRPDVVGVFLVVVLLVPWQAAGEEYGFRGLIFRIAGSWSRGRVLSLVLGIAVSALAFAALHLAADPGWNIFYLVVSVATALVTWRTGGIEIAVVIHAVFNVFYFTFGIVTHADLTDRFDRSVGAMTPALFVLATMVLVAVTVFVWLRTRQTGAAKTP